MKWAMMQTTRIKIHFRNNLLAVEVEILHKNYFSNNTCNIHQIMQIATLTNRMHGNLKLKAIFYHICLQKNALIVIKL